VAQPDSGKVFSGRYESLPEISKYIHKACEEAGFDSCATYYVETAIDEACSNIIEHAYGGENLGTIQCFYCISKKALTIVLKDNGKSFDPNKIPAPDTKAPLEEHANHGLGLYFIRKIMDEVQFQSSPQSGNTLTLVKYR
jgi:serine/threonine-protein kinase RsbW